MAEIKHDEDGRWCVLDTDTGENKFFATEEEAKRFLSGKVKGGEAGVQEPHSSRNDPNYRK
jgi:hypothetical protein